MTHSLPGFFEAESRVAEDDDVVVVEAGDFFELTVRTLPTFRRRSIGEAIGGESKDEKSRDRYRKTKTP